MEVHYTATVGARNVAWLTDPGNFDGETVAIDNSDGTITITREQMDVIRDLADPGGEEPGDLDWDDEHGLALYLPYDTDGTDRVTGFDLTERYGAARRAGYRLCAHADRDGRGAHWLDAGERCPDDLGPDPEEQR